MNLAFIRHVGPYETVPDTLFDELRDWALDRSLSDPPVWMGIGHDAPGATRPEHLRFDAALVVLEPFESDGRICHQRFEGGEFAATTHSGPLDTLPLAYASIFPRALTLSGYRLIGLPAVEIYRGSTTSHGLRPDQTDIYLPVSREA